MRLARRVVLAGIMLFMGIVGMSSQWPTTITPDAAMHAEIVVAIMEQGWITTWQPYAENEYTYPPLFHYIAACIVVLLPFEPIDVVRGIGVGLWMLLPPVLYGLLATYRKDAALVGAVLIGLVPSFANVFIYSEFPQVMGMLLLIWEWQLLRQRKNIAAGVVVGLVALTHVFFVLVALALYGVYMLKERKLRWQYGAMPVLVAMPWMPAYALIVGNALSGQWENVRYNTTQPVFGFWPWKTLVEWFWSVDGLTPVLAVLALIGFFNVKDRILRWLFVLCLGLTVFHVPFTQLKMLDLLAVPMVMLAAITLVSLPIKRSYRYALVIEVVILLGAIQLQHVTTARVYWLNSDIAPTEELRDAAAWLRAHDPERSRIYAHQASAWAGILAHKLPLNPDITHLEAFSDSYKEQLAYRESVKKALEKSEEVRQLLVQRDVRYVIAPVELEPKLELMYSNGKWGVWG